MKLYSIKYILIVLGVLSVIGFSYPLASLYMTEDSGPYLSLALLNEYNMTENYFDDGSIVKLNESINWNIKIKNIGVTKYVLLKIKIVDDLSMLPDQLNFMESSGPVIFEEYKILGNGDIENIPVEWSIIRYDSNSIELNLNGRVIQSMMPTYSGKEIILVFELWVYDLVEQNFVFKWNSRTQEQCIWNKLTFLIE